MLKCSSSVLLPCQQHAADLSIALLFSKASMQLTTAVHFL